MQNTFLVRMNELQDPIVSELHEMIKQKASTAREALKKYEDWRSTIQEHISGYLEYIRVIEELQDLQGVIEEEEGGGRGSLKEYESDLKSEEDALSDKKERVSELQSLMTAVSVIV